MNRELSSSQVETPIIDNELSLPALTSGAGDEPALFFPPSPMASLGPLDRCVSNPLVRGYSNVSVTSDEGAHFIPYGRGQTDLLLPSPGPSPINAGQFRFDAQTVQPLHSNPTSQDLNPITPRLLPGIYVPSKVQLDPIADTSECEHESRTEPTERTHVSSQMTATCSNNTSRAPVSGPGPAAHNNHQHQDDDEAEEEVDMEGVTQRMAEAQLNVEAVSFVPTNPTPMATTNLPNSGFVTPNNLFLRNSFGLSGLPHPSEFNLPQMQPQMQAMRPPVPRIQAVQQTPPTAMMNAVQGSPATSSGFSQAERNYMESTQPQQNGPIAGAGGFTPHQNYSRPTTAYNRAYPAPRRATPPGPPRYAQSANPRAGNANTQSNLSSMACDDIVRMLEGKSPSEIISQLLEQNQIIRFLTDQTGSRYFQDLLEHHASQEDVGLILEHLIAQQALLSLSEEKYANYVMQVFFKVGTPEQLQLLMKHLLVGNVYRLSRQFYACRVIQEGWKRIPIEDAIKLVAELERHVSPRQLAGPQRNGRRADSLIRDIILCDQGNHVIQLILKLKLDIRLVKFIIDCVDSDLINFSSSNYGCRVVQDIIEVYGWHDDYRILRQMVARPNVLRMCENQFGNYVIQHILKLQIHLDDLDIKREVLRIVFSSVNVLSMNKYGSNVVEGCLEKANDKQRDYLLDQILGKNNQRDLVVHMVHSKYANYVVQKLLKFGSAKQVQRLIRAIEQKIRMTTDPRNPNKKGLCELEYGKHIYAKIQSIKQYGHVQGRGGRGGKGRWGANSKRVSHNHARW